MSLKKNNTRGVDNDNGAKREEIIHGVEPRTRIGTHFRNNISVNDHILSIEIKHRIYSIYRQTDRQSYGQTNTLPKIGDSRNDIQSITEHF